MKTQKRLIIFMPSIEGGGVEKNLFIISNYLSDTIRDISIITTHKNYTDKFNKKIKFIFPKNKINLGTTRGLRYLVSFFLLFKEVLKNKNFVLFSFQANIYSIIFCKIFNIKIVVRSNSSPSGWSTNFIKKIIFKICFKLADKIIVNSKELQREFKKKFFVNTICIYNPLNKREIIRKSNVKFDFKYFNSKKKLNILTIGRFTDQKDHITLLKAVNIVNREYKKDFKLLIIGKGKNMQLMQKYIHSKRLQNKVKILNFQDNPYKFIKSCDLFILSSKFEGLPNVLLETQCLKRMIISSDCPTGPKEILCNGKAGSIFKVGDYEDLSSKINKFNKKENKTKINFGYKNLYRFDLSINLKKYLTEIKKEIL